MITIDIPGRKTLKIETMLMDYNGTIARDGLIPESIRQRLHALSRMVQIVVLTADTHGTAVAECAELNIDVRTFSSDHAVIFKRRIAESSLQERTVCFGNGYNDRGMFETNALGIAIMDSEGMWPGLLTLADVVVHNMEDGLDLFLKPKRLIATLRN